MRGSPASLVRARIYGRKRQARDRGHGGGNNGGVVSRQRDHRLARQPVCGPHTASGAGDPSKRGALALAQSQYRQCRRYYADPHLQIGRLNLLQGTPTHRDPRRRRPGKPTATPTASPTARGGYRIDPALARGGLLDAGRTAVDSTVLARTNRSSPSGSNTSPRARA